MRQARFLFRRTSFIKQEHNSRTDIRASAGADIKKACGRSPPESTSVQASHLPYDIKTKCKDKAAFCKFVYISRNPRDVANSYFHFQAKLHSETATKLPVEMFLK